MHSWLRPAWAVILMFALIGSSGALAADYPTAGGLDNFNRADGGLGGSWSGAVGGYAIRNNQLDVGSGDAVFWNTAFGADQEVYLTLTAVDPAASEIDLLLKSQSNTGWNSGLIEVWYEPAKSQVKVVTYAASQGWVEHGAALPVTFAAGDVFGARATAAGAVEVYRNGALLGTRDVSAWPHAASGGYIGLWFLNAGNALVDDFGGGQAGAVPATPLPSATPNASATNAPATATGLPSATAAPGGAFIEQGGQIVLEAEHFAESLARNGQAWSLQTDRAGFSGAGFLAALPDTGSNLDTGFASTSPELRYALQVTTTGTYYVWLRALVDNNQQDSAHAGLNGQAVASADRLTLNANNYGQWAWTRNTADNASASLSITAPGTYTLNVWMREDGFRLDRILLTTNRGYRPSGSGPAESSRAGAAATATPTSTATASYTPSHTATAAVAPATATASLTATFTATLAPATPTSTATASPTPSSTLTSTPAGTPTYTPTPAPPTATPVPAAANLLANGSFETRSLSGWETYGGISVVEAAAYSGTYGASLAATGRIDQRFATAPGQTYTVSARLRINRQIVAPTWGGLRIQAVNSSWRQLGTSDYLTLANSPAGSWTLVTFNFTADTAQTRLIFENFSGGGQFDAYVDDLAVSAAGASATPTATAPPASATPAGPTATATRTATRTAIGPTATPSRTPLPPSATPTSGPATATPAGGAPVVFALGPGGSDVVPHQIVRTDQDRLYLFVSQNSSNVIRVYRSQAAGLPASAADFRAGPTLTETDGNPISIEAAYDGKDTVYLLVNTTSGALKVYPYDLAQDAFQAAVTLAQNGATMNAGDMYVGTSGLSAAVDLNGLLQVAYWRNDRRIVHAAYQPAAGALNLTSGPTVVDTAGSANHPALAVSPLDNSLTVAWISEANATVQVQARLRTSNGLWGSVQTVSTAPLWHSTYFGLNVDQGPSLIITADGVRHLTYIQDYDSTGDYGRVRYATSTATGWTDTALANYSHDPALAVNAATGEIVLVGHGHPQNGASSTACLSMDNMCFMKKSGAGWGAMQLLAAEAGRSFDSSPSVKWSAVGFNRPGVVEVMFFSIQGGDYTKPTIHYARLP